MRKVIKANNIPVIYERVSDASGLFTMSVYFKRGSVQEPDALNGISHLIEHMVFRKTRDYTSEDISKLSEMYGGYLNAFTSKEVTCFYIKGFRENLELFIKLLANISFYPEFTQDDFDQEKRIIIDEINSTLDNPEEFLGEISEEKFFAGCSLQNPVSGTVESVNSITIETLQKYYNENYTPENCVIAVCGDVDPDDTIKLISDNFPQSGGEALKVENSIVYNTFSHDTQFKSEQVYAQMMYPAFQYSDDRRFALGGLGMILGGLMSSRLFQVVREKHGLCYNIECESVLYSNGGYLDISYSCAPENNDNVMKLTGREIDKLLTKGISEEELVMVKNQLKFSYYSNFESLDSRAQMNFRHIFHYGKLLDGNLILGLVDSLSIKSVNLIAEDLFNKEFSLCRLLP
ncbi:peptidase M16 domain protein [Denitrovibrio acetiphilus DSM 12809]|uniref:Peptidase M16 domain protein n=1 Tax=Denitrovibrio acetiphilus (strain DSM 12809 / NBRC 114555 / N2460) TaxID=522772 RepID=D4H7X4_DENA2|nr:pitrilysin family protein [Denitrovibrio acetiphilus]ADD68123.1 peptidase M16 domain protein [Denitrovibrio acetiphilus DSM 12809]